ncbi:MAG: nucleoside-diphosphate kinase [Anaerorhabdus sp.]
MERTYVMLKPDCLARKLENQLIQEITDAGFVVVRQERKVVEQEVILNHYEAVIQKVNSESFKQSILDNFVDKEVIALEVAKDGDCVLAIRDLIGATDPSKADKETLRGKYGEDSLEKAMEQGRMLNNLVHASDSVENAKKELKLWFGIDQ